MRYTDPLDAIKSISIEPNGDVAVCRGFTIGNVITEDINTILDSYNPYDNPYMKIILENGMAVLLEVARVKGIEVETQNFYSVCDLCRFIRQKIEVEML